jgi:hypothetical protein
MIAGSRAFSPGHPRPPTRQTHPAGCEREIDEVERSSHRVYLRLGLHRDDRHDN